ncbi:hypothetical protein AC578_5406 [Pseudocercospora eumusae]|uniref:Uncharacterized protein n=1 Tax=Pseudocercospora eumusae TaxID=321146 RepID=A0A139HK90_9PEZI|nr:hypothetical protein AC578_5406 [Pseudocercospora eumusae]
MLTGLRDHAIWSALATACMGSCTLLDDVDTAQYAEDEPRMRPNKPASKRAALLHSNGRIPSKADVAHRRPQKEMRSGTTNTPIRIIILAPDANLARKRDAT